jgi:hypothetical protein
MNPYKAELCRRSYAHFFREFCGFDYIEGKYHKELFDIIQFIGDGGQGGKWLVSMPPRHMKSEALFRKALPWLLGKLPNLMSIYGSYSTDNPYKYSREVRTIIKSEKYRQVFPDTDITYGNDSMKEWGTTNGGNAVFAGVLGGVTGKDCNFQVLDDLIKNRADAESETIRKKTIEEVKESFFARMEPGGNRIVLGTRWHPKDPMGQIEALELGFKVINLPANDKDDDTGNWLFPERFPPEKYLEIKKEQGSYGWNSKFKGNPRPPEGGIWKRKFARIESAEQHAGIMAMNNRWGLYYDLAFSEKKKADLTAGAEFLEYDDVLYIRRPSTVKQDMGDLKGWLANDIVSRGVVTYGVDKAFAQSQFAKELTRIPSIKHVRQDPLRGAREDKFTSFLPILGRFEAREVVFIHEEGWESSAESHESWDVTIEEMASYKVGQKESPNRIDMLSHGYRMLIEGIMRIATLKKPHNGR